MFEHLNPVAGKNNELETVVKQQEKQIAKLSATIDKPTAQIEDKLDRAFPALAIENFRIQIGSRGSLPPNLESSTRPHFCFSSVVKSSVSCRSIPKASRRNDRPNTR